MGRWHICLKEYMSLKEASVFYLMPLSNPIMKTLKEPDINRELRKTNNKTQNQMKEIHEIQEMLKGKTKMIQTLNEKYNPKKDKC